MISCFAFERSRTIVADSALEDVVLEPVELVAHLAEHRERGVDVGVDDPVQQVARALREGLLAEVLALSQRSNIALSGGSGVSGSVIR